MSLKNDEVIGKILNPVEQDTLKNYPSRIYIKLFQEENENIHLRLFPPKSLGFPKSIQVFKINREYLEEFKKDKNFLKTLDNSENFKIELNNNKTLIRFNEPMLYVKVILDKDSGEHIKCFYKSMEIASTVIEDKPEIIFEVANITDVLIPLSIEYIKNVEYIKESTVINTLKTTSSNIRISIDQTSYIMKKLNDDMNVNIYNSLEEIQVPSQNNQKKATVSLLQYLNFLALDPKLAKDLGLYGIDDNTDEKNNLYLLKGTYDVAMRNKYYYGFIYQKNVEKTPNIEGKCTLKQIEGITYKNRTPLGQIALNFNPSKEAVFYEINRLNKADQIVVTYSNHMVSRNSKYCFTESNLPLNDIIYYKITPIDIFGERGETVKSDTIVLKNISLPVPVKNIKAKIIQNGFPWHNIEEYKNKEINKGMAHISFEYGEQQHLISPDVDKVTLLYRVGNKTQEDWNNLDKWIKLKESVKILSPIEAQVSFENGIYMTNFAFSLKEIRKKEYSQNGKIKSHVELLLNETFLEPSLFQNFTFIYNYKEFRVINSHAGIAYNADKTINKDYTTRLIVKDDNEILKANHVINLMSSNKASIPSESLLLLTLNYSFSNLKKVSGGEIALDVQFYKKNNKIVPLEDDMDVSQLEIITKTFIGKIVNDIQNGPIPNRQIFMIVRFKTEDFRELLIVENLLDDGKKINSIQARYYAPYLFEHQSLIINNTSSNSNISINIDASQSFETVFFSAISYQKENISSLAIPFETKIMNPPEILADIPIPYLCNGKKDGKNYAPPANVDGYSNPRICWDSNGLEGVSYELSRALDKTIIATDKKNWLQGISTTASKNSIGGTVENFNKNEKNGTFTLKMRGNKVFYLTLKAMEQGRIKIQDNYYQLLKVLTFDILEKDNITKLYNIQFICKPFIEIDKLKNIEKDTAWLAEQTPNYEESEKNDELLRGLANKGINKNAFGLVTATPIPKGKNFFTDTIPAKGSNRFFYRLRVVFASGHKSAWSECSEGIYQFPSTPKKIKDFTIVKYKEQYMVSWQNLFDSNIDGYLFYKKEENERLTLLKEVKSDELLFKPRFIPENFLIFSKPIEIIPSNQNLENEEEIESYLLSNVSVVGLQEDSNLEINLYGDESSFLYEIKEEKYHLIGLKQCTENLSDFKKVKVSILNIEKPFEEVVGRDENIYVVYLDEEEIKKDDLVVVPYVEVDSFKLWERNCDENK